MPHINPHKLYSRQEVADLLAVGKGTIRGLIAAGKLKESVIGYQHRIYGQHLLDYLAGVLNRPEPVPKSLVLAGRVRLNTSRFEKERSVSD